MGEIKKINFKTLDDALTEHLNIPSMSISDELKDSRLIELNTIVLDELFFMKNKISKQNGGIATIKIKLISENQ